MFSVFALEFAKYTYSESKSPLNNTTPLLPSHSVIPAIHLVYPYAGIPQYIIPSITILNSYLLDQLRIGKIRLYFTFIYSFSETSFLCVNSIF